MLHLGPGMTRAPQTLVGVLLFVAATSAGFGPRHAAATRQSAAKSTASQTQVTFNRDIAPIVFRNCAQCHHPGEAGPFPLLSYSDVKTHGKQIAFVTSKHIMPPWLPEPGDLKFAEELRLPEEEIATLQTGVDQGEMEGTG